MSTKSLINEKPKAEPTTHQLQGSKEKDQSQDKYEDQCHEEVEVDHLKRRQHERLQEKAAIDNYKQLCTTIPVNTPLKFKQNYTGNTRFRENVYGEAEASNVHPKRTKGDQEIVGEGCIRQLTSGSKDRHCKVSTPKGLRDRRVRLSAETAIEFYDVQDRLGFDRPSKAIDWLMKEAEAAIEALGKESTSAQLPYHSEKEFDGLLPIHIHQQMQPESKFYSPKVSIQDNKLFNDNPDNHFSFISLLCGSTPVDFPNYQHGFDPRIRTQTQDLCLSLQSFEDDTTILKQNLIPYPSAEHQHSLIPGSIPMNFNKTSNPDWFQKMIAQNSSSKSQGIDLIEGNFGPFLEQNQISLQRESLQSTMLPSINSPLVELDYPRVPAFNASSATSAGALYNHFQISQDVRGREETIKSTSISSSATSSFLQYQDFQNQEFDSSHKTEELKY